MDPGEIAEDVTSLFAERARERQLDLVSYVSPGAPRLISGDPIRLNQIISNLVNNALKFTESGSVILRVGPDPKQVGHIRFAVTDTGIGIRAHKLRDLFGAFTQADQSTNRRFGGSGLGLAISKRLVDAMGGSFDVRSVYRRGSTFSISIPTGACEAPDAWPRISAGAATAAVAVKGDATRATLLRYLGDAGYDAHAVRDGAAIAADLIVIDPDQLGRVRRSSGDRMICLGTFGDPTAHQMVGDGRADAAITRPLRRSEIRALLRKINAGRSLSGLSRKSIATTGQLERHDNLRVLVADDTAINREVAFETLQQLGAVVSTVESGAEAIDAVETQSFDVVLMDVSMPEIDGLEATRRIRAREKALQKPRLPIIAVTAHVVGNAADAWRAAGMDAVLYKPYTIKTLASCISGLSLSPDVQSSSSRSLEQTRLDHTKSPLLNEEKLNEQGLLSAGGATAFLHRVFDLYMEHSPKTIAEMRRALQNGDNASIGRTAHALRSMSVNIAVERVVAMALDLEQRAQSQTPAIVVEDIERLGTTLRQTHEAIRTRYGFDEKAEPDERKRPGLRLVNDVPQ